MIEKKILILGGSGTIGSYINYFLSQNRNNEIIKTLITPQTYESLIQVTKI